MSGEMYVDQTLSLFIPRVFTNITSEYIRNIIDKHEYGEVKYIDMIPKVDHKGRKYNMVYIRFHYWYDTEIVHNFQKRVLNPVKEARIVYDDPYYWVVRQNKYTPHNNF